MKFFSNVSLDTIKSKDFFQLILQGICILMFIGIIYLSYLGYRYNVTVDINAISEAFIKNSLKDDSKDIRRIYSVDEHSYNNIKAYLFQES